MSGANLPPLKTRKLGRTNVRVTELGLGTAPLGELFDKVDDDEAAAIIGAAWDGGVRYFDTSPWYGRGLAEHSLGRALHRRPRDQYVISTKIGRVLRRPLGPNAIKDQWLGGLEPELDKKARLPRRGRYSSAFVAMVEGSPLGGRP